MPRQLRIEYPGAMYHVMSRGNRRQEIFLDDVDRQDFSKPLRRKHDPAKLEIAARLYRETTLSVKQIAPRLHLGTPKSASVRLLRTTRQKACGDPAQRSLGI
jgi:hypothetical protein